MNFVTKCITGVDQICVRHSENCVLLGIDDRWPGPNSGEDDGAVFSWATILRSVVYSMTRNLRI